MSQGEIATLGLRVVGLEAYQQTDQALGRIEQSGKRAQASTDALGGAMTKSHMSTGRLNQELLTLTRSATGLNPVVGQAVNIIGQMAISGAMMTGVLAGVTALSLLYQGLTRDAKAAREENDKLTASLAASAEKRGAATPDAMYNAANKTRQLLNDALEARRHAQITAGIGAFGFSPFGDASAEEEQVRLLTERYKEQTKAYRDMVEQKQAIEGVATRTTAAIQAEAAATADLNNQLIVLNIQLSAARANTPTIGGAFPGSFDVGSNSRTSAFRTMGKGGVMRQDPSTLGHITGGGKTDWGAAAQIGGGMLLGSGLAGDGYLAAGLSSGMSMAAQGAMLGSVVPGIGTAVGAVVGGVAGLVSGLFGHAKKAREAAEQMKIAQTAFDADLNARRAAAGGNTDLAADLRRQAAAEKELAEARKAGMSKTSIAALQQVQAEEAVAASRERAIDQAKKLEEEEKKLSTARERAIQFTEDLNIRVARATGQGGAADTMAMDASHRREWAQAIADGMSSGDLSRLSVGQAIENEMLQNKQLFESQTAAIQAFADAELQANAEALKVAQDQLRVHEQAVNAMRQIVASLTDYSNSLALGANSPLTPKAQLDSARGQFEMMRSLALGGDASAAASLSGSSDAFLRASQAYNPRAGTAYGSDFQRVQDSVNAVRDRFAGQLTIEEQQLAEARKQTAQLEANREQIQTSAAAQIKAFQDEYTSSSNLLWKAWSQLTGIATNTNTAAADKNEIKTLRDNTINIMNDFQKRLDAKDGVIADLLFKLTGVVAGGLKEVKDSVDTMGTNGSYTGTWQDGEDY